MLPLDSPRDNARTRRFRDLYRAEFAFVWAAARRMGVAPPTLEDVVQDVFLTAYRRLDGLQFEVSARAWLHGVTRRVVYRQRRSEVRHGRRLSALASVATIGRPPAHDRHDHAHQLERLLAALDGRMRAVWEMTELLGMTASEIAGELGVPLNTVYSRLRLARQHLHARLSAPDRLAALCDAARRTDAPPQEQARRTWAALLPALGPGKLVALGLAVGAARAAIATTLIAAGVVAVGVLVPRAPPPAASAPVSAAPAEVAPSVTVLASTPAASEPPASPPSLPRRASHPGAPAGPSASAEDRLREEVALLGRADAHLDADEPRAALDILDALADRFPHGALADVREAARVRGLCALGEVAAAEAAAARVATTYPRSAVAQHLAEYRCTP